MKPSHRSLKILSLTTLSIFLCFGSANAQFGNLDKSTLREFTEDRTEEPQEVHQFLSRSSNCISFGMPVSLMAVGLISGNKITQKHALYIGESILINAAITTAIKNTVRRPRPFVNDPTIIPADAAGSFSFPSGHTSQAFATATSLSIAYPKWYVIAPAYLWASSVAYSRMYLGVHYPSDVLAGALVGAGSAWLTYKLNRWLNGDSKD